jgi:hypothetical protein
VSTSATIQAIQAINRAISGITSCPDGTSSYPHPGQVNAVDLPIVILFPGAASITSDLRADTERTRTYAGVVLVAGQAQGQGINETITDTWTLFDALADRYDTMIGSAEVLSTGEVVTAFRAQGQQALTYRGATWEGYQIELDVWTP